jgi:protein-disulfide isomerase
MSGTRTSKVSGTRTSKVERMPEVALSPLPPIGDRDHVAGSDSPDVTLVEYGDFGCPFCFAASVPVRGLLDRFDTLRLVWRHFPDAELHPGADLAAELSEVAAVHGRFWEAHLLLLAGREKFTRDDLLSAANRLELEMDEAETALHERTFRKRVLEDAAGGRRAGAQGTPTFFVNGERLEGHWRQLAHIIPAKIAESGR